MNDVVIRALRFSADVEAMRRFLETLGLQARVEAERGGWAVLPAGRGAVSLHDAATSDSGSPSGHTELTFEAEDIDELKERLESAGYDDATIWDEAFGRVLSAAGPDGTKLWIDEHNLDLYGYKVHETAPDRQWSVTPGLLGSDQAAWERLLDVLGTDQRVHFGPGGEYAVRLELTTTEELADVERRMSGYEVSRVGDRLEIVDPDGQVVVVHG